MTLILTSDIHYGHSTLGDKSLFKVIDEIKTKSPDVLIIAGDFGSSSEAERADFLRRMREDHEFSAPVGIVNGNHDFWDWDGVRTSAEEVSAINDSFFLHRNITHLQEKDMVTGNVVITGFDGWYSSDPPVNDPRYIPGYSRGGKEWLRTRAETGFARCLGTCAAAKAGGKTTVIVTHFGFFDHIKDWKSGTMRNWGAEPDWFGGNPKWEDFLGDVDYVLFGHSHRAFDGLSKNGHTRLINCGSDYNNPKYIEIKM